jgi:hypothetical protein
MDIDTARSIAAGSRVILDVCGKEVVLSSRAVDATRLFATRFSRNDHVP